MKFGSVGTVADLLVAVRDWLMVDPPALFNPGMAFICGPDEKEWEDREPSMSFVEVRGNKLFYDQPFWAGGGEETQVVSVPLQFNIGFHYDVDIWKQMDAALTNDDAGAQRFRRLFMKRMNAFQWANRGVSKLVEPVRPLTSEVLGRSQNQYFKIRVIYQCKICENMS